MATMIRASMLPAYPDCPRRAAAKQWRREIEDAGFTLRETEPSVGAATGTAVHHAAAIMLRSKREVGDIGRIEDAIDQAIEGFRAEIAPGAVWDDSTPNRSVAEFQITRQTKILAVTVLRNVEPMVVENTWPGETEPRKLKADCGDGYELTGTVDLVTTKLDLDDLKTGALPRPYQAQLGGYSLLLRSQPEPITPHALNRTWLRRTPKSKAQPEPERSSYDRYESERAAAGTIAAVKQAVTRFREGGSSDPWAFVANPMSMMCGRKYCPAWGTAWCALGRPEKQENS